MKILALLKQKPELIAFTYYLFAASVLALIIKYGIGADETYHYGFIQYYATHSLDPVIGSQYNSFDLGEVSREPSYLYHYLLSWIYRLSELFSVNSLYALRFMNILMGLGTIVTLNSIGKRLKINSFLRFLTLMIVVNIPAFLFLSSYINYDNLVILLTSLGLLISIKVMQRYSLIGSLILFILAFTGPLVKFSFLPMSLIFGLVALTQTIKNTNQATNQFFDCMRVLKNKVGLVLLLAILILSMSLFVERYVKNSVELGSFRPECNKVLTHEQCLNNYVYKRTFIYKSANLPSPQMPLDIYMANWANIMVERTYGLLSHKKFESNKITIAGATVLFYTMIILFFRRLSVKNKTFLVIPLTTSVYLTGLIITNYSTYVYSGNIGLAVQGRYWLPVLLPSIFFVVHQYQKTLSNFFNWKPFSSIIIVMVLAISIYSGLPNVVKGISGQGWVNDVVKLKNNL